MRCDGKRGLQSWAGLEGMPCGARTWVLEMSSTGNALPPPRPVAPASWAELTGWLQTEAVQTGGMFCSAPAFLEGLVMTVLLAVHGLRLQSWVALVKSGGRC